MRKLNSKPAQLFWQFAKISSAWGAPTDSLVSSVAFPCKTFCVNCVVRGSITNWKANIDENDKNMRTQAFQNRFNWITGNVTAMTSNSKLRQLLNFAESFVNLVVIRCTLSTINHPAKFVSRSNQCSFMQISRRLRETLLCKSPAKVSFSALESLPPNRSLLLMQLWSGKLNSKATFKRFPSIFPLLLLLHMSGASRLLPSTCASV